MESSLPKTTLPTRRRAIAPPRKEPEMPPPSVQIANLMAASKRVMVAVATGQRLKRTPEETEACMQICRTCELWNAEQERCSKCGCFGNWKSRLATEVCPLDKWPKVDIQGPADDSRLPSDHD